MKALQLSGPDQTVAYTDCARPELAEGMVAVRLKAAALNHRDVFITQGKYPGIKYPIILGSDGAGLQGEREVIINPSLNWGADPRVQGKGYHILGLPTNGTFAEWVAVPAAQVHAKPAHLSWEETAALPLAGLTAYRALFTRGNCTPADRVLISGIGGGVALFALQFALAIGAEVWVTSGSEEKLQKAGAMGAAGGANYRETDWHKDLQQRSGGFDLIIDSAGGEGFNQLLRVANPGGRLVIYGGTRGSVPGFSPQMVFWKQLSILGSTMGHDGEFTDMLDFVSSHGIHPVVDSVFPLEKGAEAFQRMAQGKQFGKVILQIP